MGKAYDLAESYINGNISWVREQIGGSRRLLSSVARVMAEYWPGEVKRFLELMGREG